jgi:hypothetical protein
MIICEACGTTTAITGGSEREPVEALAAPVPERLDFELESCSNCLDQE